MTFLLFVIISSLSIFSFSSMAEVQKPYSVFLKAGTILTKLSDKSEVILSEGIYAKVLEKNFNKRDLFYVYDKNGVALFQVAALDLVEIIEDTKLLPSYDAQKIYPAKLDFKADNKFALLNSQLNVHIDSLAVSDLNDIYNDQIGNVVSFRYEARTFYISNLPLDFGLSLNYQSAYWKNDIEQVKLSILSLGPQFRYRFKTFSDFNIFGIFGAEIAPIYNGSSDTHKDKYSASLFDLGIESEWHAPIGVFSLGSHFRHHRIALLESDRTNIQLLPKEFSLSSVGVMFGYKIEWDL